MPSRGVQDYGEINKKKAEDRKKKQNKLRKWCGLAGLTIFELILCLGCFGVAYFTNLTILWHLNIQYLLLPRIPIIVSTVYLAITFVDVISWCSLRPITYFAWITVATSGFLMFMVYAGVCLFNVSEIAGIVGIIIGCITALVFLADTICCLMSLKRFPVPYWLLKRKYEKFDECVCTADHDPDEEKETERPICKCGDNWGEPCSCDADPESEKPCKCGAHEMEEPPCPCCECSTQALVEDQDGTTVYGSAFDDGPQKSIVTTATGRDYLLEEDIDPKKSTMVQVDLVPSPPPDFWCMDGAVAYSPQVPRPKRTPARSVSVIDPRSSHTTRKSMTQRPDYDTRKSPSVRRIESRKSASKCNRNESSYSVYTTMVDQNIPSQAFEYPSLHKIKNLASESHGDVPTCVKNINLKDEKPVADLLGTYTSDEEYGVGDYSRRQFRDNRKRGADKEKLKFSTYTSTDQSPSWDRSSSLLLEADSLPGLVPERHIRPILSQRRVSAYPGIFRLPSENTSIRPQSENLSRTMIRNVSTTVRPVRTLSSVIETSHESGSRTDVGRRSDTISSECTITINK